MGPMPSPEKPKITFTPEQRKELIHDFYQEAIKRMEMAGGEVIEDITQFYAKLPPTEEYVVRRQDGQHIIDTLVDGQDMPLALDAKLGAYANSVEWSKTQGTRGLLNAFQEGMANFHGMATVVGFRKGKDLEVGSVPDFTGQYISTDRSLVRSSRGVVHPEDLRFMIFRTPSNVFPDALRSEKEEDEVESGKQINIFRAVYFPHGAETPKRE